MLEAQAQCIVSHGKRDFTNVKADLASNTFLKKYKQVHQDKESKNLKTTNNREVDFFM